MLADKLRAATAAAAADVEYISSSIQNVNATNNTVTAPSGIQDGDLLVAYGIMSSDGRTVTLPSGFNSRFFSDTAAAAKATVFIATKVASSESGDYTFTWSASRNNTVAILVYRNATDSDRLIGAETGVTFFITTAASISPTSDGALIAFFSLTDTGSVSTAPSGMTELVSFESSNPSVAIYGITPNGTGATGDKTLVWDNSKENSGIQMQIYKA